MSDDYLKQRVEHVRARKGLSFHGAIGWLRELDLMNAYDAARKVRPDADWYADDRLERSRDAILDCGRYHIIIWTSIYEGRADGVTPWHAWIQDEKRSFEEIWEGDYVDPEEAIEAAISKVEDLSGKQT